MGDGARSCWVCGAQALVLKRQSTTGVMRSEDFAISDSHYGRTAAVYQCAGCGFLECPDVPDVVPFYEDLEDPAYVESRPSRVLQSRALLRTIARLTGQRLEGLRLLDIGAGSGPLVEAALAMGVRAEGVEPSRWLCEYARRSGLPVHHGVLPHPEAPGPFDVVSLIDVIEHTTSPLDMLGRAVEVLAPGGVVVIVTPDVSSIAASLLGWRWWHYRTAHVGYFNRRTLARLCTRAGLTAGPSVRPGWVLPLSYLVARVGRYLPFRLPTGALFGSIAVPFNLGDSILLVARRP